MCANETAKRENKTTNTIASCAQALIDSTRTPECVSDENICKILFLQVDTQIYTLKLHTLSNHQMQCGKERLGFFFYFETRKEYTQREKGIEDKETHAMCMHEHSKTPIYIAKTAI